MKRKLNHIILLCLCCLSFCIGAQLVGQTEASFSNQAKETFQIRTAFVFPSTIRDLEQESRRIAQEIQNLNKSPAILTKFSSSQLKEKRKGLLYRKKELEKYFHRLSEIKMKMENFYVQAKKERNIEGYSYVIKSYQKVDKLLAKLHSLSSIEKIEEVLSRLNHQIRNVETEETMKEKKHAKEEKTNTSSEESRRKEDESEDSNHDQP